LRQENHEFKVSLGNTQRERERERERPPNSEGKKTSLYYSIVTIVGIQFQGIKPPLGQM
jgi:hypothetical protein